MDFAVEEMKESDLPQASAIYLSGIRTGLATFQRDVPEWEEWNDGHSELCRLVARSEDGILGWAALTPVSTRCVYAGVAEVSIYIGEGYRRHAVGTELLTALSSRSEENGFWTLQSGIIRENSGSIRLHEKCGFRMVGYRERLGRMEDGRWHDVVLMERRSRIVGS